MTFPKPEAWVRVYLVNLLCAFDQVLFSVSSVRSISEIPPMWRLSQYTSYDPMPSAINLDG